MLQGVKRVKKRTKVLLWKRKKECKETNSPESGKEEKYKERRKKVKGRTEDLQQEGTKE